MLGVLIAYVALFSGVVGALIYKRYDALRRDAEAFRRITGERSGLVARPSHMTSPEAMAEAIEAIAIEVERIAEGQRFVTKLLAEKRRPDTRVSPLSPIPGLGSR
ncbi:MAG TPA: hypothetical protein VG916_10310 [Gemmatimonadaceae bacterium]|nr:hypothetical protein [Gemmatimonadaceae bacterium]